MFVPALLIAAAAANVPELPREVPPNAARSTVTMMGQPAGQMAIWSEGGKLHAFFQFNDRGRGPKTFSTTTLRGDLPVEEVTEGVDYMKAPVRETFSMVDGTATWKSKAESGSQRPAGPAFYASIYGSPNDLALLARAALDHGGRIALLPGGECRAAEVKRAEVRGQPVALYAMTGLDLSPFYLWLDARHDFFAIADPWFGVIREGWEGELPGLIKLGDEAKAERSREQAARLAHRPRGPLVIHDVTLFDAEDAAMVKHQDVIVEANHVVMVEPTSPPRRGAEVIEGAGKTLLPGLWDMHAHVGDNDGLLNLAAGVTSVRDLANDDDQLILRRKRIEEGTELGTRIVMAGIIDGPGPFQGPTKMLAGDEKTAREIVDKYAAMGIVQIKIYSSVKPELVAPIAEEAHRLGLRVSGHIPAGLIASEAVRRGYDEIQHANFLALNFMPDVKETRTPARFLEPAKRTADLDLSSAQVRDFIQLLRERHVTLDPTLSAFESLFLDQPGAVSVPFRAVADRLPVQVRRGLLTASFSVPPELHDRAQASFRKILGLIYALYVAGVPIEAGTDAMAGFALHRELELDVEAGIPAPRVLQLATLGAARIMGFEHQLGSIRPGKLADMVLIDGDPSVRISDVRKPAVVIKDGVVYRPAELDQELGIRP